MNSGILFASAFGILLPLAPALSPALPREAPPSARAHTSPEYGRIPLSFEANNGQTDKSVRFLSRGEGYSLFLTDQEAVLAFGQSSRCPLSGPSSRPLESSTRCEPAKQDFVRIRLVGANKAHPTAPVGEDPLSGKVNYFLGSDPTKWHTDLPTYGRVKYTGVYDGIDLVYYGNQRQLEHDFVVAPGADPGRIVLSFQLDGAAKLRIDAPTGDLIVRSGASDLRLLKPVTYQQLNGRRTKIPSRYKLLAHNRIAFTLGHFNHAQPLIIDPVLIYSTYLGGTSGDRGSGIAVDSSGNAYVTGSTNSINFPVTASAFQSQNFSIFDNAVFVTKLNAAGTALIYSTYLGGSGSNYGVGIAVGPTGNAYVTGSTYSLDFPVTCGAFQTTKNSTTQNSSTPFVTKLSAAGDSLIYSTYLGAKDAPYSGKGDVSQAIAVNAAGNAFVTGYTYSADFPVTAGAFQTTFAGSSGGFSSNAFVTELNQTGAGLQYSTYLGGSGASGDFGNAIAIDASGDAFVSGSTSSANFPVTAGALQTSLHGTTNAFVTEMNPTGTKELFSTYLGGSSGDSAQAIAVDSTGFAYVAGYTHSSDFPTTSGVLETSTDWDNSPPQGFVAKLNLGGTALEYSTYLEGQQTTVTSLAVDTGGTVYVTGTSPTANPGFFGDFMPTPDALASPSGSSSAFLVKLNPSATALNYATLIGGSTHDSGAALALDASGNVYLTGSAFSTDFPTSSGAFQTTNHASASQESNAFVTKFALATETHETAYPSRASSPISTTISVGGQIMNVQCNAFPDGGSSYDISFYFGLQANAPGPPMTGTVTWDGTSIPGPFNAYPAVNGAQLTYNMNEGPPSGPITVPQSATYTGDSNYAAASASYTVSDPGCAAPAASVRAETAPQSFRPQFKMDSGHQSPLNTSRANLPAIGPKFVLPAPVRSDRQNASSAQAQEIPCIGQHLPLKVTVHNSARQYGAANPVFTYTITGLVNGDTLTVTPSTTATAASPVGNYTITASVSGPSAPDYLIVVVDGTLSIHKAVLSISAANVAVTYGHTPPPLTAYKLAGFVNGDTAGVVSGAPILTTTVTAKTPVGSYPIGVQVGSLTAANYSFSTLSNGMGGVQVYKAILSIEALSVFTTYGKTPPPLTAYRLLGFVNGDTASLVSGAPILTTTVTATTHVGSYPIQVKVGTLSAANYYFNSSAAPQGVVTVAKATLAIHAHNVNTTYGQAPPKPTAYDLVGFVNGDTASVVSGAPLLTTAVTSTTPVGFYQIGVHIGTLTAANYTFSTISNGMGSVGVYKANLNLTANNLTMTQGSAVPPLTYTISGFVNGDTVASAVTGSPVLTTAVTSATKPGRYYIIPSNGTLTAHNYDFHAVYGILTVLP